MNRAPTLVRPAANFIFQRYPLNYPHDLNLAAGIRLSTFELRCVGG